ncbi:MAG: type II toxin-antitoxin system RelE/ParE family toxin [Endomicrobium sp.]|jgi:putative addiction module killer protein|nr:type II toxin-antitoxin system RelE/ParE family toxin [Endomicrobium sp.]
MTTKYEILRTNIFNKWFDKQNDEVQEKVIDNIDRIHEGNFSNCKLLRNGIFELKINYGKGIRIYYTKTTETILILLYGGTDKKQQAKDIEKAIIIKEAVRREI